jgi:ketopantoate hydroxymethyltransferase
MTDAEKVELALRRVAAKLKPKEPAFGALYAGAMAVLLEAVADEIAKVIKELTPC